MPVLRIPIDGLWLCLCPLIDTATLSQSTRRPLPLRKPSIRSLHKRTCPSQLRRPCISLASRQATPLALFNNDVSSQPRVMAGPKRANTERFEASRWGITKNQRNFVKTSSSAADNASLSYQHPVDQLPAEEGVTADTMIRESSRSQGVDVENTTTWSPIVESSPSEPASDGQRRVSDQYRAANSPLPATIDDVPISQLYDWLYTWRDEQGSFDKVVALVEYMIVERKEKIKLIHYDSLVRINVDAEHGSVRNITTILLDMQEQGLRPDSGLYHGILQALAVHPNYLLRAQIMQEMKDRWFGLSPEGWHFLVAGLLRDRQIEIATDKLEQMHIDEIRVQPWLYNIFLYQLCEADELDEAFKLLQYIWNNSRADIHPSMWLHLLDRFSSAFHYEATKYIWAIRVQTEMTVPSDGICVAILNLAARNSDPALATAVVRILSARRTALSPFHYEALINAYVGFDELKTAFRILSIMAKAGNEPTSSSTRHLYLSLSKDPGAPARAWEILKAQNADGHIIPIAAINVVIEASVGLAQYEQAVDFYKELHQICEKGPNTESFNTVLQGLSKHTNGKDTAMFLASEMAALDIAPDALTYDRLIIICLTADDYEDAFRYLEEMVLIGGERSDGGKNGWWMRQGTAAEMIKRCGAAGDSRAWDILEQMKQRNLSFEKLADWLHFNWDETAGHAKQTATQEN